MGFRDAAGPFSPRCREGGNGGALAATLGLEGLLTMEPRTAQQDSSPGPFRHQEPTTKPRTPCLWTGVWREKEMPITAELLLFTLLDRANPSRTFQRGRYPLSWPPRPSNEDKPKARGHVETDRMLSPQQTSSARERLSTCVPDVTSMITTGYGSHPNDQRMTRRL